MTYRRKLNTIGNSKSDLFSSNTVIVDNSEFYELEESLVYYVITDIDDETIDRFLKDTSNNSDEELAKLKREYIGAIVCRPLSSYSVTSESNLPIAFPIESNIRNYPVFNEVVITAKYFNKLYYWRLNTLEGINSNPRLSLRNSFKPNPNAKGSAFRSNDGSISSGIANSDNNKDAEKLGNYFEKNNKIHMLKPYEGDIIFEGRFGQSIRLGGYNTGNTKNSFNGESPFILIRNNENQEFQNDKLEGDLIEEDINGDGSSIHITSGKMLSPYVRPTETIINAFINYPEQLEGDQIILNSNRLILSSKASELIGHGKKSIGFITDGIFSIDSKDSINIWSTDGNFHVNTRDIILETKDNDKTKGNIFLGENNNKDQPLVLGNKILDWLTKLCNLLENETHPTATGPSGHPINASRYSQLKRDLKDILSTNNFTI